MIEEADGKARPGSFALALTNDEAPDVPSPLRDRFDSHAVLAGGIHGCSFEKRISESFSAVHVRGASGTRKRQFRSDDDCEQVELEPLLVNLPLNDGITSPVTRVDQEVELEYRSSASMVSVVVSIQTRKMFAEVRKMFVNARHAEQDVSERQASMNF